MAYTLQGRSGTVQFHQSGTVTAESKKHTGKLTNYPIENNSKITDHYEKDPTKHTLRGVLAGNGAAAAVATLEKMMETADFLTYTGSYRMENIVITDLDFSTDSSNRNGFSFSATFQFAPIVGSQYVGGGDTPLMSQQDAGKSDATGNSGKPAQDGLQTTVNEAISSGGYADYVSTFDSKITPSAGPLSRSTPSYTGF